MASFPSQPGVAVCDTLPNRSKHRRSARLWEASFSLLLVKAGHHVRDPCSPTVGVRGLCPLPLGKFAPAPGSPAQGFSLVQNLVCLSHCYFGFSATCEADLNTIWIAPALPCSDNRRDCLVGAHSVPDMLTPSFMQPSLWPQAMGTVKCTVPDLQTWQLRIRDEDICPGLRSEQVTGKEVNLAAPDPGT